MFIEEALKAFVVGRFQQVKHFVDDDIFEALAGFFSEFGVYANRASGRAATSPFGFHPLNEEAGDLNAEDRFPFGDH